MTQEPISLTREVPSIDMWVVGVENLFIMVDYPFVQNIAKLESMFNKVRDSAVPPKFTVRHWARLGFSSSQDRGFIDVVRFLGYIDENGTPTQHYPALRDMTIFKEVLAERVRDAYKEMFYIDTNANTVSEDTTAEYMARLVNSSAKQFYKQAQTFRALCVRGDFRDHREIVRDKKIFEDVAHRDIPYEQAVKDWHLSMADGTKPTATKQRKVIFNINLPTTANPQVYKAIFENLKNLFE